MPLNLSASYESPCGVMSSRILGALAKTLTLRIPMWGYEVLAIAVFFNAAISYESPCGVMSLGAGLGAAMLPGYESPCGVMSD